MPYYKWRIYQKRQMGVNNYTNRNRTPSDPNDPNDPITQLTQ